MQGVGVEDWLSIFIFVFGVHGRITRAGVGRWNSSIGLQNAAVCTMVFVYDRLSWIITAFRAGPVPAGQLGGDKKLLSWTIPIEPSRSGEAHRNNTIDVRRPQARRFRSCGWLGDGEVAIGQGCISTLLGSPVVECIPYTLVFWAHHHSTDYRTK